MTRRAISHGLFAVFCAATAMLAIGPIVRCTVQDRIPGLSLFFYASPWPVIALGALIAGIFWKRRGQKWLSIVLAVECLAATGMWLASNWQWRPQSEARGALRVVHWNVDRPDKRQAGTMQWLAAQDADIIAIAERQPRKLNTMSRWEAAFPGFKLVPAKGETLLLVRGEVASIKKALRDDGSFATVIHTRVRDRDVTVVQTDLYGGPGHDRSEAIRQLIAIVERHRDENMIVLGDFNTPADSALLAPIRRDLTNAFEAAGHGCIATWPMPLPVLSLDQIWTSHSLKPVRCEHFGSWRSDHRAVVAEIDFVP